jgi:hypothetical protein
MGPIVTRHHAFLSLNMWDCPIWTVLAMQGLCRRYEELESAHRLC